MRLEKNILVPMRDGTVLALDLYLPDAPGRYPVVLERTPYNKERATMTWTGTHKFLVEHAYAVALQDTRGRFASQGTWYPFRDEGWGRNQDGHDTVEWLAQHPACNGAVGTFGGSYSGSTQYLLAPTRPRGLKCMFARQAPSDLTEQWVYRGGAFELGFNLHWAVNQSVHAFANRVHALGNVARDGIDRVFDALPAGNSDLFENPFRWLSDFLSHPPGDRAFWEQWNLAGKYAECDVPILHFGGWYDIFLDGTLANYAGIARTVKAPQKLVVGPWRHGPLIDEAFSRLVGELDFGPEAHLDFNRLALRWFDHWLKGVDTGLLAEPPVSVFVMGADTWRTLSAWPPPGAEYVSYYLREGGSLAEQPPAGPESPDRYRHDPMKPVRTIGGATLFTLPGTERLLPPDTPADYINVAKLGLQAGPRDQRPAEAACLTFTTPPLEREIEVTGPVKAELFVLSDAGDTDFVVKLTDVWPDGRSMLVTDGILRARYEHSTISRATVDLWATSQVFKKGHRIRMSVASSNFPRFDRNMRPATNAIYHDREHPSRLILPVIAPLSSIRPPSPR